MELRPQSGHGVIIKSLLLSGWSSGTAISKTCSWRPRYKSSSSPSCCSTVRLCATGPSRSCSQFLSTGQYRRSGWKASPPEAPHCRGFFILQDPPADNHKASQMLKDCRCGRCKRLLARIGKFTELQIKCSRCGTLNHMKATSLEPSPVSDMNAECSATQHSTR